MEIKKNSSEYSQSVDLILNSLKKYKWNLFKTIGMVMIGITLFIGGFYLRDNMSEHVIEKNKLYIGNVLNNPIGIIQNYLNFNPNLPQIRLDIKHKHLQKLVYTNLKVLEENDGNLITTGIVEDLLIPIHISYKDKTIKAKARNKGFDSSHRSNIKFSLQIELKGDNTLMGMNKFSLYDPKVKSYIGEWLFHQFLRKEDFIAIDYELVEVIINGKSRGVHAIEAHFDRYLLKNNGYNEGVILGFDYEQAPSRNEHRLTSYPVTPIISFDWVQIREDSLLRNQFLQGKNLLEAFRQGDLPTSAVFDINSLAKLFALSDILGEHQNLQIDNIKFYYNPTTSKLQPIGYNQTHSPKPISNLVGAFKSVNKEPFIQHWQNSFFKDTLFFKAYVQALEEVSSEKYQHAFWSSIDGAYHQKLEQIRLDFPFYKEDSRHLLSENSKYIKKTLESKKHIEGYHCQQTSLTFQKELELDITGVHSFPIELTGLYYKGKKISQNQRPTLLLTRNSQTPMELETISFSLIKNVQEDTINWDSLEIGSSLIGLDKEIKSTIHDWIWYDPTFIKDDNFQSESTLEKFHVGNRSKNKKYISHRPSKPLLQEIEKDLKKENMDKSNKRDLFTAGAIIYSTTDGKNR